MSLPSPTLVPPDVYLEALASLLKFIADSKNRRVRKKLVRHFLENLELLPDDYLDENVEDIVRTFAYDIEHYGSMWIPRSFSGFCSDDRLETLATNCMSNIRSAQMGSGRHLS